MDEGNYNLPSHTQKSRKAEKSFQTCVYKPMVSYFLGDDGTIQEK